MSPSIKMPECSGWARTALRTRFSARPPMSSAALARSHAGRGVAPFRPYISSSQAGTSSWWSLPRRTTPGNAGHMASASGGSKTRVGPEHTEPCRTRHFVHENSADRVGSPAVDRHRLVLRLWETSLRASCSSSMRLISGGMNSCRKIMHSDQSCSASPSGRDPCRAVLRRSRSC